MKKAINVILGLCALVLLYLCYESIMAPIHFNEERAIREEAVKARLLQIRNAEDLYRQQHEGEFCDSFSVLINFIKTAKIPHVSKVGELSDEQLEKGLTDAKAAAIVASGDAAAIAENGLQGFRRDTTWSPMAEAVVGPNGNPDSLQYIPYGNGATFELEKTNSVEASERRRASGDRERLRDTSGDRGTYVGCQADELPFRSVRLYGCGVA